MSETVSGDLRLVIDDIEREAKEPPQWRLFTFVTDAVVTKADLIQMNFTDQQLADFGRLMLGAIAVHVSDS